ncbi:MAG: hypothetical protein NC340_04415 [Ruminococcus flavefaciens]|nr:hypothetical protein [Ruminococcus flavefaciens]MCM1229092.1 hypothetical protein [Ruminococcus flavefaciens]
MKDNNKDLIKLLRQKYRSEGYDSLTDEEKLLLFISYSEKAKNAAVTAENIINTYGNIHTATDSDALFLVNVCGISTSSTALLNIIPAVSNMLALNECSNLKLNSSENAGKFFSALLKNSRFEKFVITVVNKNFKVRQTCVLAEGEPDKVNVPLRKIYEFAQCYKNNYTFISHCHPNSSSRPSNDDINTTLNIIDILDIVGAPLADHIIVGCDGVFSMREHSHTIFSDVPKYTTNPTTDE